MIIPVILCGGSGTRLWPLSRTSYPKQLLPLFEGKSLLQQTMLRIRNIPEIGAPIIICNNEYRFVTAEQLRDIGCDHARIILEPVGRNTAPAVTVAALQVKEIEPNAVLLILPADHLIHDHAKFIEAVNHASQLAAASDNLVTFGVVPTKPETGYGYIHKGSGINANAFAVKQFVEKPDKQQAEKYVNSGEYYWNSGMFLFKAASYLRELEKYGNDILQVCTDANTKSQIDTDFYRLPESIFKACRSESIDYAVMEKSESIAVVPLFSDWSDVGSWNAMWDLHQIDPAGNVLRGDVTVDQVNNCYLHAESRLLAAVGVSDLAVVETSDAVLITNKANCQNVKALVNLLKKNNRSEVERHKREYRPWGHYETLKTHPNFNLKQITVKPGGKLSLQMHQFRSEHWVITKGIATVTCGEQRFELSENQSTFIPAKTKHRLENMQDMPLELIEVQTGTYFGEDDIVRFDDIYQRTTETTTA